MKPPPEDGPFEALERMRHDLAVCRVWATLRPPEGQRNVEVTMHPTEKAIRDVLAAQPESIQRTAREFFDHQPDNIVLAAPRLLMLLDFEREKLAALVEGCRAFIHMNAVETPNSLRAALEEAERPFVPPVR